MSYEFKYQPPEDKTDTPPLLKPGWYHFKVLDCYDKDQNGNQLETQAGDPYLKIRAEEKESETIVYHSLFFSDQGRAKVAAFLYATGMAGEHEESLQLLPQDFMGKTFLGKVGFETYNGRQYNRIEKVRPFEDPAAREDPTTTPPPAGNADPF